MRERRRIFPLIFAFTKMANSILVPVLIVGSFILSYQGQALGAFNCDFEQDLCSYTQDRGDDFDWARLQGTTETSDTGPGVDHTHGTTQGYYLYAEASNPQSNGDIARLTGMAEDAVQQQCVEFYYYMYGDTMGSLRVYVKDSTSSSMGDPVWSLSGDRGRGWYRGLASVDVNPNKVQLVLEAEIGDGKYSDIAIDDIKVVNSNGLCPIDFLNCTFESGVCGFVQDKTDEFDFTRAKGKTSTTDTGPSFDHTIGTEDGYYMYTEATTPKTGEKARLISPTFRGIQGDDSEKFCVVFWYHMYGKSIGELNVYLRNSSSANMGTPIWSLAGNRGDVWRGAEAEINTPEDFTIIFEGIRGTSYMGDIAIDDVLITSYGCPGHHIVKNESSVSCSFEEVELCYYVQDDTDTIDWEWKNRGTKDAFTGPDGDHTRGDELGFFLYVSNSILVDSDDVARIMSPVATASTGASSCVEFWYHMWGRDVETLKVYIKHESSPLPSTPTTSVKGDQGNYWHRKTFTVAAGTANYRVVFEAIPGESYRDDIAIDDVMLYQDQSCPEFITDAPKPPTMPTPRNNIDCDFEVDFCGYTQDIENDYGDWSRLKGKGGSSSFSTGPEVDHTLGTALGYYASFDPYDLKGAEFGDMAILESPVIAAKTSSRCLTFYAYMWGSSVDYLTLNIREWGGTTPVDPPFAVFGNHGKQWIELTMDVPSSTQPFQILFVGSVGTSKYSSEIAMDDITLKNGQCQAAGTEAPVAWSADCDFESTTDPFCGYENYKYNKFEWVIHSGSTITENTGPSNDHTFGTAAGHYAYVESSIPHRPDRRTILASPVINSGNQDICVRFYYHAYGKDIGSLTVDVDLEDFYDDITPFSISGDQGNKWLPANVDIPASFTGIFDYRIEIVTEKISPGFEADIAIDDIMFLRQPCDGYPSEATCNFEQGPLSCGYSDETYAFHRWQWYDLLAVENPPLNTIPTSYMYAMVSTPSSGQSAVLYSAVYNLEGWTHCLTLDIVLTADSAQQLMIQAQETRAKIRRDVGRVSGDLGGNWVSGNWTVPGDLTYTPFQLIFTAVFGSSTRGVIAIDNVFLSKHMDACKEYVPPPTNPPIQTSSRPFSSRPTSISSSSSSSSSSSTSGPTTTPSDTASRKPQQGGSSKVGMIVGIIIAMIVVVVVVIVVVFLKFRNSWSTSSLTIGYKNEKIDEVPFSGVAPGNGGGGSTDPQVVIGGTKLGSDA